MVSDSIQSYLDGYLEFLKGHSFEEKIDSKVTKLTLPFLDSLNDCTEIFIVDEGNDNFLITDNGETISELSFNGVTIKGVSKEGIFQKILNSYEVLKEGESLYVRARKDNLFLKKHLLLQCIAKVNDMYMLNRSNVQNIFLEEVKNFFEKNDILYVPNHRLTGKSGLTANYEFAIPKHQNAPFTLIKTLNNMTKEKVKSTVFDWTDTKDSCDITARLFVIYNDEENIPKEDSISALKSYGIDGLSWKNKDTLRQQLLSA